MRLEWTVTSFSAYLSLTNGYRNKILCHLEYYPKRGDWRNCDLDDDPNSPRYATREKAMAAFMTELVAKATELMEAKNEP